MKQYIEKAMQYQREQSSKVNGMLLRADRIPSDFLSTGDVDSAGIPILSRLNKQGGAGASEIDPNIRISSDFVNLIGNEKAGYLAHNILRTYSKDMDDKTKESLQAKYKEFDDINQSATISSELMELDAISGIAYSLYYVNNNIVRKKIIFGGDAFIEYENGVAVAGVVINKKKEERHNCIVDYIFYVYDTENRYIYEHKTYNENSKIEGGSRIDLLSTSPHGFGKVPLVEWKNNKKGMSNAEKVVPYIDAYDLVLSDSTTEISQLRQAYLLLKNAGKIDETTAEIMRKTGVLAINDDAGDGKAEANFLQKSLDPAYLKEVKSSLEKDIFRFSRIVDSAKLMELTDPRKNQIDFIYRSMDNDCDSTQKQWDRALQYEDEILKSFWTVIDLKTISDYDTFNINYVFIRNKPKDELADLEAMKRAGVELPNYKKLIVLGYEEDEARSLSEEAQEELLGALNDNTTETE